MAKAMLRTMLDEDIKYNALLFWCPGCAEDGGSGIHMLPVDNCDLKGKASWVWNNNLEKPTLEPSILTRTGAGFVCHSYLRDGVFEFLEDCTHSLKSKKVEMPEIPLWITDIKDVNIQ